MPRLEALAFSVARDVLVKAMINWSGTGLWT
jgi:hypothetical protein